MSDYYIPINVHAAFHVSYMAEYIEWACPFISINSTFSGGSGRRSWSSCSGHLS